MSRWSLFAHVLYWHGAKGERQACPQAPSTVVQMVHCTSCLAQGQGEPRWPVLVPDGLYWSHQAHLGERRLSKIAPRGCVHEGVSAAKPGLHSFTEKTPCSRLSPPSQPLAMSSEPSRKPAAPQGRGVARERPARTSSDRVSEQVSSPGRQGH